MKIYDMHKSRKTCKEICGETNPIIIVFQILELYVINVT